MTRLTIELPDDLAESITLMAANRGYGTPQMAVELMRASVSQREAKREREALKSLSDEDVLALADLRLTPQQDARLHKLLDRNSEGKINARQRRELDGLMEVYHDALLRKAMGWAEAVRRKLRPPISS